MRSQKFKNIYFLWIQYITRINSWRWSIQNRLAYPTEREKVCLNLGCGDKYAEGFVNLEGNVLRKKDLWLDLRNGLPFPDGSVDAIYSCHLFEHFYIDELEQILAECHRVLKPQGGIRILVPSLEQAISAYVAGQREWFTDLPASYESIGGRFFNFVFCESQHRLAFDFSFLEEILVESGFRRLLKCQPGQSDLFSSEILMNAERVNESYVQTSLIVEAWKD